VYVWWSNSKQKNILQCA